jgi:hypothetical protein
VCQDKMVAFPITKEIRSTPERKARERDAPIGYIFLRCIFFELYASIRYTFIRYIYIQ